MKTIYSTPDSSTSPETRISVLQSTLGGLRLANIATLDAITTHFTRLIDLTTADEDFISNLAQILAPCILRPRIDTSLTMHERHSYRLIRDLFAHKEAIFGELKRANTHSHTSGGGQSSEPRLRAKSTDESNRRANMEARTRAIVSKSRASSPAPHANGRGSHRRDRSSGPGETRFPVQTSPTSLADGQRKVTMRASLEVPATLENLPPISDKVSSPLSQNHIPSTSANTTTAPTNHAVTNPTMTTNNNNNSIPASDTPITSPLQLNNDPTPRPLPSNSEATVAATAPKPAPEPATNGEFAEKRESLTRGRGRFPARQIPPSRASLDEGRRPVAVQLSDRPMDD